MATSTLTTPGAGYATDNKYTEAQLIAMGAKGASPDSQTQTMAVSIKNPGVTVGGAYGTDPNGVPTQYQARTQGGNVMRNGVSVTPENAAWLDEQAARAKADADYAAMKKAENAKMNASPMMVDYGDGRGPVSTNPIPTNATIGEAYGESGALGQAYDQYGNLLRDTQKPIDENAIRENTLKRFQAEIDATNQYYQEVKRQKLANEVMPAQNRLGSDAAIQSRRGMLGSTFGGAQTDRIETYNAGVRNAIEQTVDAERIAAIQSIMGKARDQSQKEIEDKVAARTKGAQEYIAFLKGAADRKDERANTAIASLLASGQKVDDTVLGKLAKTLGMELKDLKDKYNIKSKEAATEAAKNKPATQEVDGILYERQADGTYKAVTPAKAPEAEKPLIVGGVAYQKQSDGSYKPITPVESPKPLTRQVGKQLYTSTDNGLTWQPAKTTGGKTLPASSGSGGGGTTASVTLKNAKAAMTAELSQLVGDDGYISPDAYKAARKMWADQKLNPTDFDTAFRGYRNPNNPYYVTDKG